MSDDPEFLSNVKALADNGTLKRLLEMIEEDCVSSWKNAGTTEVRENAWLLLKAVQVLQGRIASLCTDESVRNFNYRRRTL
jgi:hypothetical protein